MTNLIKRIGVGGAGLALAVSSLVSFSPSVFAMANSTGGSSAKDPSTYSVRLRQLNKSGVKGDAQLTLVDQQPGAELMVKLDAWNTEPDQIHAMHIHGMLDNNNAECPAKSADTNGDSLVSVFEGAPFYGPIKVNFTSPATTFGPPSRTDLFAPFAGIPVGTNFPKSNVDGDVTYNETIPFDQSNHYATEALTSLTPLTSQHIVLHGGYAPESVDTPGGDPNKIVYDGLLPIACGEIVMSHQGSAPAKDKNMGGNEQGSNQGHGNGNGQGSNQGNEETNGNDESTMPGGSGHGSSTTTTRKTTDSSNVTNANKIQVTNNVKQTATTGNASAKNGTSHSSGSQGNYVTSGNATNNFFSTIIINIMNWSGFRHMGN